MSHPLPHILCHLAPVVAVDKPSGFQVHPTGTDTPDLLSWLRQQPELVPGLVPVHRLDAGASGVVLCAATPEERATAAGWFDKGQVHKRYLVLVHGRTHRKGVIRRPLKDPRRKRPMPAITRYRLVEWLGPFSLLRVTTETGRRHQIRRHLHGIGHAVVGDDRYGPRHHRPIPADPQRLWLHAWQVELPDGRLATAELPAELEQHLALLRQ